MELKNIKRFEELVTIIPAKIAAISEKEMAHRPAPNKWSKKEILGHLLDSAANNQQRFVRGQFENVPFIKYDQNNWNTFNHYQDLDTKHIVEFWTIYNRHLIEIAKRIPTKNLKREVNSGGEKPMSLAWFIDDYVEHMDYHLRQIVKLEGEYKGDYGK
jgi:hypothetical protein